MKTKIFNFFCVQIGIAVIFALNMFAVAVRLYRAGNPRPLIGGSVVIIIVALLLTYGWWEEKKEEREFSVNLMEVKWYMKCHPLYWKLKKQIREDIKNNQ